MSVIEYFPELLAVAVLIAFLVGLIWGAVDRMKDRHICDSEVLQD